MSGQYAIAKYIPLKIRRQMVAVTYRATPVSGSFLPYPACANGKCPMGWLPDVTRGRPSVKDIARSLKRLGLPAAQSADLRVLQVDVAEFTNAWDRGEIKNLRKALGVPK